jgi:hypothetical protein
VKDHEAEASAEPAPAQGSSDSTAQNETSAQQQVGENQNILILWYNSRVFYSLKCCENKLYIKIHFCYRKT